jgi:hypothetical protein
VPLTEMIPITMMMLIPVVAIIGGITAGIVKSHHRARMIELAQRERIAAIERGLDISQLPPLPPIAGLGADVEAMPEARQLHRSRGLTIWGIILACLGLALVAILLLTVPLETGAWGSGFFFLMLGVAFLISARVIRPDLDDLRREKELIRQMRTMGYSRPAPPAESAGTEARRPTEG